MWKSFWERIYLSTDFKFMTLHNGKYAMFQNSKFRTEIEKYKLDGLFNNVRIHIMAI